MRNNGGIYLTCSSNLEREVYFFIDNFLLVFKGLGCLQEWNNISEYFGFIMYTMYLLIVFCLLACLFFT